MSDAALGHVEGFLGTLVASGIPILAPRRVDFLRALTLAPLRSAGDLYWVARVTLLSSGEQIEPFDRVFDDWFRSGALAEAIAPAPAADDASETVRPGPIPAETSSFADPGEGTGRAASQDELLNRRVLAATSPGERAVWARMARAVPSAIPRTGGRRRVRDRHTGTIDLRRVLAGAMQSGGEIVHLRYRRRPRRMRRVLVLIDVSGSLKAHSPGYLRFAHAIVRGAERVEVFTFGTRLTRITPALRRPDVDDALARLAPIIADFDGGTRIGGAFAEFLAHGRHRAFARGATIVVLSDGLERGDPGLMAATTERLARLGHRLLWLTPLLGDAAYRPATRGMQSILDSLDRLGDASSPGALLTELERLPDMEHRPRRRVGVAWREGRSSA